MGSRGASSGRAGAGNATTNNEKGGRIQLGRAMYDIDKMGNGFTVQIEGDEQYFDTRDAAIRAAVKDAGLDVAFRVDWENAKGTDSASTLMQKHMKKNNIDWFRNQYGSIVADVDKTGDYYKLDSTGWGYITVDRSKKYKK